MSTDTYGPPTPAAPVPQAPRPGAGRKPNPNPFLALVREAIEARRAEGADVARSVTFILGEGESFETRASRIRRQLTAAGKIHAETDGVAPYKIERHISQADEGAYVLTVWARAW